MYSKTVSNSKAPIKGVNLDYGSDHFEKSNLTIQKRYMNEDSEDDSEDEYEPPIM